jgi:hypothetical protein
VPASSSHSVADEYVESPETLYGGGQVCVRSKEAEKTLRSLFHEKTWNTRPKVKHQKDSLISLSISRIAEPSF